MAHFFRVATLEGNASLGPNNHYMEYAPPLSTVAVGLGLGIAAASRLGGGAAVWGAAAAAAAVASVWAFRFGRRPGAVRVGLLAGAFALGGLLLRGEEARTAGGLAPFVGRQVRLVGVVVGEPAPARGVVRLTLAVERVAAGGRGEGWRPLGGRVEVVARVPRSGPLPAPAAPGDRLLAAGRLRAPRGPANPGDPGEAAFLRRAGAAFVLEAGTGGLRLLERARGADAAALAAHLRRRLEGVMRETLPPREAALLQGLVLGDRGAMSGDLRDDFRRAGLAHILSVSGLHVGFVAGALLLALRPLALGPRGRAAVAIPALALYTLMTGAQAPVVRAAVMFAFLLVGRCLGRPGGGLQPLAAAFAVIAAARPTWLFDPGCQLSFAATGGILVAGPPLRAALAARAARWRRRPPAWAIEGLAVSLAAQAATLPLIMYDFGMVSPVSLVANLVAVPLAGAAVPLGFAGALAGLAWPAAAGVLNRFTALVVAVLADTVSWFAAWPGASVAVPRPPAWAVAAAYAALAAGWGAALRGGEAGEPRRSRLVAAAAFLLAGALLVVRFPGGGPSGPGAGWPLEALFLDVGQGDGMVFFLPGGRTLVVDGGPPPASGPGPLARYLAYRGVRRIDVLVATHGDADHVGGLAPVVETFRVGEVWYGVSDTGGGLRAILRTAAARGARLRRVERGQVFAPAPGVRVTVLNPRDPPLSGRPEDDNDNSVVLRLQYGAAAFLLAADLEAAGEADLLASGAAVAGTVLKVGHHGSAGSSGAPFLAAVAPRLAVIQVGARNAYGHPRPEVLARLAAAGASVWRTDRDGAVIVRTDGRRLAVTGMRRPARGTPPAALAPPLRGAVEWGRRGSP